MSIKLERLESDFIREISKILEEEIRDEDIYFVTITSCKITSDLSYAKVYFTTLGDKEKTVNALNKASKYIRMLLSSRVEIRKMPEISFVYDEAIEYGNKIEGIIERINKDGESSK